MVGLFTDTLPVKINEIHVGKIYHAQISHEPAVCFFGTDRFIYDFLRINEDKSEMILRSSMDDTVDGMIALRKNHLEI